MNLIVMNPIAMNPPHFAQTDRAELARPCFVCGRAAAPVARKVTGMSLLEPLGAQCAVAGGAVSAAE
ncbi:MAG: hypothetical protein OD918_04855 [Gammaproteobacteria bacterium]